MPGSSTTLCGQTLERHLIEHVRSMLRDELHRRGQLSLRASGNSMWPLVAPTTTFLVHPLGEQKLRVGDIIAFELGGRLVIHRLYAITPRGRLLCKGDWRTHLDPPLHREQVLGRVVAVQGRWSRRQWNLFNRIWITLVVWPVGWLLLQTKARPLLGLLKRLAGPVQFLQRLRLRLRWRPCARPQPGLFTRADSHLSLGKRMDDPLGYQREAAVLQSYSGSRKDWPVLLEAVKHQRFGWREGQLLTPDPNGPGWDWQSDREWLDFLLAEGFAVRREDHGLHLALEF